MHVRIAWEIYNHQQKEKTGGGGVSVSSAEKDKMRAFPAPAPPPPTYRSPYDLPPGPYLPHHAPLGMVRYPARPSLTPAPLAAPADRQLGVSGVSPFARYGAGAFPAAPGPFALSAYGRELALSSSLHGVHHAPPMGALHDAWRGVRPPVSAASAVAAAEARRDHEERERARRERDERERRERDERERRKAREQRERDLERVRARSPLRNGVPEPAKEERKEPPRPPPTLPAYPPAHAHPHAHWDPYRAFDPLQHMRFAPLVEAAIRAEEDRAKMLSAYAHHQQLKSSPLLHRGLPGAALHGHPHAHAHAHPALAPLAPLAPGLAPLAPLDLLKKEEPR